MTLTEQRGVVFVIDDDALLRESIADLVRSVGLDACALGSPQEFLQAHRPDAPGCIVLDVRLPGASGLEFQRVLTDTGIELPVIFITGYGDIATSVKAIKSGAKEFLTKPVRDQELLDAVHACIAQDRARREQAGEVAGLRARFETLTPRERDVLPLVISGRPNKQIAGELGLSDLTVKVHRTQIMRKMQARSLVDLVRMADKLGISAAPSPSHPIPKH